MSSEELLALAAPRLNGDAALDHVMDAEFVPELDPPPPVSGAAHQRVHPGSLPFSGIPWPPPHRSGDHR